MSAHLRRAGVALLLVALAAGPSAAKKAEPPEKKAGGLEGLFLDFSKTQLGPLATDDAKKKYLYTIQIEKSRLMQKLLRVVYENAYDLYKDGDFDGSRELTNRILSMDPGFQDAAILNRAAVELRGTSKPILSERKLVDDRFEEGMALYRQGRLVEVSQRWEEALKLSPTNLKARYWLRKVRGELAAEHFRRGQKAYKQHLLRDALDQWYAALVLDPKYPRLVGIISKAEAEIRRQEANDKLQKALTLYGQGQTEESLRVLDEVLQVEPGEPKAQKLIAEIRLEIANQHVAQGRQLYRSRQYTKAISQWDKAVEFGYDPRRANLLIARAKEQMRREADAARRREEERREAARRAREEAEQRAREEEERRKKEEEERARQAAEANPPPDLEAAATTSEDNKRAAMKYWAQGLIHFSKQDLEKARNEWLTCKQYDPSNSDCQAGLSRIDQALGGP